MVYFSWLRPVIEFKLIDIADIGLNRKLEFKHLSANIQQVFTNQCFVDSAKCFHDTRMTSMPFQLCPSNYVLPTMPFQLCPSNYALPTAVMKIHQQSWLPVHINPFLLAILQPIAEGWRTGWSTILQRYPVPHQN